MRNRDDDRDRRDDDGRNYGREEDYDNRPVPGVVVAAVALATIAVPFLAIYAVLFLVHGSVHPVVPPDVTGSSRGEFVAGLAATAVLVVSVVALVQAMGGRRRWPFLVVQAAMLAASAYFLIDGDKGGTAISAALALTSAAALLLINLAPARSYFAPATPAAGAEVGAADAVDAADRAGGADEAARSATT